MNSTGCIDSFQSKRFWVLFALFSFVVITALKLDNVLDCSFWYTCIPLWLWKLIGLVHCILSLSLSYDRLSHAGDPCVDYVCELFSLAYLLCLLGFEIMVCFQLESGSTKWVYVFVPLFLLCILGGFKSVWDTRAGHACDIEMFVSVHIVSFVFVAGRLDDHWDWTWTVVFSPVWIVMAIAVAMELFGLLSAALSYKARELEVKERKFVQTTSVLYAFVIFPLLGFLILLASRLDNSVQLNNISLAIPLLITIMGLMLMTCCTERIETYWFGMNKPLYQVVLSKCRPLQKYGNVACTMDGLGDSQDQTQSFQRFPNTETSQTACHDPSGLITTAFSNDCDRVELTGANKSGSEFCASSSSNTSVHSTTEACDYAFIHPTSTRMPGTTCMKVPNPSSCSGTIARIQTPD